MLIRCISILYLTIRHNHACGKVSDDDEGSGSGRGGNDFVGNSSSGRGRSIELLRNSSSSYSGCDGTGKDSTDGAEDREDRDCADSSHSSEFIIGQPGSSICPTGSLAMTEDRSAAVCRLAARQFCMVWGGTKLEAGYPAGCYIYRAHVYFNYHSKHGENLLSRSICLQDNSETQFCRCSSEGTQLTKKGPWCWLAEDRSSKTCKLQTGLIVTLDWSYCSFDESTARGVLCSSCSEGEVVDHESGGCIKCGIGKYAGVNASVCTRCNPGQFAAVGSARCSSCAAGEVPNNESSDCVRCDVGKHVAANASTCIRCSDGQFAVPEKTHCLSCPAGEVPNDESNGCVKCEAGTHAAAKASACTHCGPGRFASRGSTLCSSCPAGKVPNNESSACITCRLDEYADVHMNACGHAQSAKPTLRGVTSMTASDEDASMSDGEYGFLVLTVYIILLSTAAAVVILSVAFFVVRRRRDLLAKSLPIDLKVPEELRMESDKHLESSEGVSNVEHLSKYHVASESTSETETGRETDTHHIFAEVDMKSMLDKGLKEHWVISPKNINIVEPDLAEGGFGTVSRAFLLGNTEVAVKMPKNKQWCSTYAHALANEIRLLRRLRHTNIVLFYGVTVFASHDVQERVLQLSLVLEWISGGDFHNYIQRRHKASYQLCGKHCDDSQIMPEHHILIDVARGMQYLHGQDPIIVHRDLKPGNILVEASEPPRGKISDFGISALLDCDGMSFQGGTKNYMASDVKNKLSSDARADVFSFGCVCFYALTAKKPKPDTVRQNCVDLQHEAKTSMSLVAQVAVACLREEPAARIKFIDAYDLLTRPLINSSGRESNSMVYSSSAAVIDEFAAFDCLFATDTQVSSAAKDVQIASFRKHQKTEIPAKRIPSIEL